MTYEQFIERKLPKVHRAGFEPGPINPNCFPWQKRVLEIAIRAGRYALFEDCGLGKALQELEWCRQCVEHTGKPAMILTPLAVSSQMKSEAEKFGIKSTVCRTLDDWDSSGINILNYERLHLFESVIPDIGAVALDESSVLKAFDSKTTQRLIRLFVNTTYRLCGTATPAPNDYEELGNHAEFLGYATRLEMLSTYFIHDSANTADWRLKKHSKKDFWKWISTWAACISKPSDIGYSDEGYILPPLNIQSIQVTVDETEGASDGELFRMPSMSSTTMHSEMRRTCAARCEEASKLVNNSKETFVVWCNTNYESDVLRKLIPDAVEVRGSDTLQVKEEKLNLFTSGKIRSIISKPSITGHGLNWQFCFNHVFVGLSYSFEDFYQAMRRGYRFGQRHPFNVWIIQAQTEGAVRKAVMDKIEAHKLMQEDMKIAAQAIKTETKKEQPMSKELTKVKTDAYEVYNNDAVEVAMTLPSDSVGFSVYSPPFASLYLYSDDPRDMGNCADNSDFIDQYRFLIKEKFRITEPGRLTAVHCADLPAQIWKDGYQGLKDFSAQIREVHEECGWIYHCRVTIWKDPVVEMQRTKALGLLYKQLKKDSARCRVGNPDYLMVFRKPGDNECPIEHTPSEYPVEQWQKDASPVWMDIEQTNVLNREGAREQNDEKHIAPLQLDVIRRSIRLWSAKNDLVYSPFMGIGSEGYCAIEMGRRFVGSELKESYFKQAVQFLAKGDRESASVFEFAKV